MGFLDHSTNNVIIDAVLTDHGRRLLAENQGSFKIAFFSLGDDEVDYSMIRKFGRTVGKEKIAKNTPIFEAQTASSLALKHRLITLPDPLITRMPSMTFSISGAGATVDGAGLGDNSIQFTGAANASITFSQSIAQGSIPTGLTDQTYTIFVNDRFLSVTTAVKVSTQSNTRIAAYSQTKSAGAGAGAGSSITITLARKSLDDTTYSQFGDFHDPNQITSVMSVVGDQSGLRKDIKVTIRKVTT